MIDKVEYRTLACCYPEGKPEEPGEIPAPLPLCSLYQLREQACSKTQYLLHYHSVHRISYVNRHAVKHNTCSITTLFTVSVT